MPWYRFNDITRQRVRVFAAFWAVIFGLEWLLNVPAEYDPTAERFWIAVLLAAGLTFFWFQIRSRRPSS